MHMTPVMHVLTNSHIDFEMYKISFAIQLAQLRLRKLQQIAARRTLIPAAHVTKSGLAHATIEKDRHATEKY